MNILYQKARLLGRPFRTADDEWWSGLTDGGDGGALGTLLGDIWSGNYSGVEGTGDQAAVNQTLYEYLNAGAASAEEAAAITKALADAKISDMTQIPKGLWDTIKNAFKKSDGSYDWAKLAAGAGALISMSGLGKAQLGGYKGTVPTTTAVREQIKYDDPNRRPGAGGRDYFTDTKYVDSKDTAGIEAAKTAAQEQAAGILAGYKKADAPKATANVFKTPWEKAAATGTTAATTTGANTASATLPVIPNPSQIAQQTYPEKFMDNTGGGPDGGMIGLAAGGTMPRMRQPRYLQGITDGMEDKIKTTIDGKQDALLSHGEFVIPADVVSHLGNGNSDAGAKKLYQMMDRVRQARTGTKQQGKQINPDKYMPGGQVGYDQGGIVAFEAGGSAGTTTSSGLAPYVGDYATKALGDFQAATTRPYEGYTAGPLTAGASDLQSKAFTGVEQLATTGYTPGTFTTGTFDTAAANKYMNPYLEASLNPQLKELRRQAQISNLGTLAKAGRAGILGGASSDLMQAENMRNLLSKQSDVIGTGYANAFDKAMQQFNTEQGRQLETQKEGEASRRYSADYARNILGDMGALGKTQRDIEAEGIAADKAAFEEQRDYDAKSAQARIALLQKMPVSASTTETATNPITDYLQNSATIIALFKNMGLIPK